MALFYGDYLGLGYLASNMHIPDEVILQCAKHGYAFPDNSRDMCIAGIDVHKIFLHITIAKPVGEKLQTVYIGKLIEEDDIEALFRRYSVGVACFDAMPETRMLKRLKNISALKHIVYSVTFHDTKRSVDIEHTEVVTGRTSAIDEVQTMLVTKQLMFPNSIRDHLNGEFLAQMTSSVRASSFNEKGQQEDRWICKPGREDHFLLSMAYLCVANQVMKKTFTKSALEEMANIKGHDAPKASVPLFGLTSAEDVLNCLTNHLILQVTDQAQYLQLVRPALSQVLPESPLYTHAKYWLIEFDAKYNIKV